MKKNILLSALLCLSGLLSANAQAYENSIIQGPENIESANANAMFITGISGNGKYCWGNSMTTAYYYNTETGEYTVLSITDAEKAAGYKDTKIAGITNDGIAIISYGLRECYALNIQTGEKTPIESPLQDFPYVHVWDMTPDGKIIAGNCINDGNKQRPAVITRQEDGTYKVTMLEYDSMDAMGAPAQFTQARAITNDGKNIGGSQVSETGFVARYVTWELNDKGVYEFKTPFDELLYDFTQEKPGVQPTFEEYVTATDKNSEEYKQQKAEFDKAFKEHRQKMTAFTRNYSNIDWGGMRTSFDGNYCCGTFKKSLGRKKNKMSPLFYDCDTKQVILVDSISDNRKGWDILPENRVLTLGGPKDVWFEVKIIENGEHKFFHEWIQEKTGTDISAFYYGTFTDKFTWTTYEGTFIGHPVISADGKTMVTTTWLENEYKTSIIKFENNIFGSISTGIENEVVSTTTMNGSLINAASAVVDVYTFDGMKVNTFKVAGSIDLANELSAGSYIVKVNEGSKTKSFKLIIK